jgi:hypothetical protein
MIGISKYFFSPTPSITKKIGKSGQAVVVHASNPSTPEVQVGEFETRPGYIVRSCLKKNQKVKPFLILK